MFDPEVFANASRTINGRRYGLRARMVENNEGAYQVKYVIETDNLMEAAETVATIGVLDRNETLRRSNPDYTTKMNTWGGVQFVQVLDFVHQFRAMATMAACDLIESNN